MGLSKHEKWSRRRAQFREGDRKRTRAVFVGINYTNDVELRLNGCQNDVKNAIKYLKKAGFDPEERRVLLDDANNEAPTRANIIDAMQWLTEGSAEGDVLWFHFSGHGEQVRDGSGDEIDGKDEAIVPLDARTAGLIADDVINEILTDIPEGVTLYAVFDCCHSGTIMDLPFIYDEIENEFVEDTDRDAVGEGTVVMFSGCLNEQKSADLGADFMKGIKKSVGALSRALYKKLDRKFTYGALVTEIRTEMKRGALSQVPQLEAHNPPNPDDLAFADAFGLSRSAGVESTLPPAKDAGDVPVGLLHVYKEEGRRLPNMNKYIQGTKGLFKRLGNSVNKRYAKGKAWASKKSGSSRSASVSSGSRSTAAYSGSDDGDSYYYSD